MVKWFQRIVLILTTVSLFVLVSCAAAPGSSSESSSSSSGGTTPPAAIVSNETYLYTESFTTIANGAGGVFNIDLWNGSTALSDETASPIEGTKSLKLFIPTGNWAGVGFRVLDGGVVANTGGTNMASYKANGHLNVQIRMPSGLSTVQLKVGVKSGDGATGVESWKNLSTAADYDDAVHTYSFKLSDFSTVDFSNISHFFMIATVTGTVTADVSVVFDSVYWTDY